MRVRVGVRVPKEFPCRIFVLGLIVSVGAHLICVSPSLGQKRIKRRSQVTRKSGTSNTARGIDEISSLICRERLRDPQATIPIDQMAIQPRMPIDDRRVVDGRRRAERLLPGAKRLVPAALSRLAAASGLEPLSTGWIISRVNDVTTIKPEVEQEDNAAWRPNEPHAIIFGTIFLAGLRSDEAMIAILAHELTHAVNGTDRALQPVFDRVKSKASGLHSGSLGDEAAAEITCEMVGLRVLHAYVAQLARGGTLKRRLSRGLEKNCVLNDQGDASHLSPRETLRLLLGLEPEFTAAIAGHSSKKRVPKTRKPKPSHRTR